MPDLSILSAPRRSLPLHRTTTTEWEEQMNSAELLTDGFGRVSQNVHRTLDGLAPEALTARLDPAANSIAWLVWHLTRNQDDHLADAFGGEQLWTSQGWADRFALPFDVSATGYGQSSDEVAAVRSSAELLLGYLDAVTAQSLSYLKSVTDDDLDRIVDTNWDPPVTLGVRLISVLSDGLQHAGQAAFTRGIIARLG
jgi:hypothetical protein